jgi:hypothetical protein
MELKKYYLKYLSKYEDDEIKIDEINAEKDKGSLLTTPFHSLLLPHTCC